VTDVGMLAILAPSWRLAVLLQCHRYKQVSRYVSIFLGFLVAIYLALCNSAHRTDGRIEEPLAQALSDYERTMSAGSWSAGFIRVWEY
jgi:hypothetical protein